MLFSTLELLQRLTIACQGVTIQEDTLQLEVICPQVQDMNHLKRAKNPKCQHYQLMLLKKF